MLPYLVRCLVLCLLQLVLLTAFPRCCNCGLELIPSGPWSGEEPENELEGGAVEGTQFSIGR
jgi:hypothetical protein